MNRRIKTGLLILALPVWLMVMMPGIALAEGAWQADSNTGCKVWNANPQPQETFTWTGGCKNGYLDGTGILQWSQNGIADTKYEGSVVQGKMHGKGVYIWMNGFGRYEGDFVEGKLQGTGVLVYGAKSNWPGDRYEGDFYNNMRQGYGVYFHADGRILRGRFQNNKYVGP